MKYWLNTLSNFIKIDLRWSTILLLVLFILTTCIVLSINSMYLGRLVITQCFLYRIYICYTIYRRWFSYILFIIILGGVLILFIYVIRISSNELLFDKSLNLNIYLVVAVLFFFPLSFVYYPWVRYGDQELYSLSKELEIINFLFLCEMEPRIFLFKVHNISHMKLSIFLIAYLFFCIVVVVFIVDLKKGSFRSI